MRIIVLAAAFALAVPAATFAQAAPAPAAGAMTTDTTTIGDLLDNAEAKAVLQKHLPTVVNSDQIDMARGMTLKDIQTYAPDDVTDAKLAAINHDLAALKK